ncbi:MAG: hypothetical protein R3327_05010 [Nitrosopumilaceae archaeon]|nr:hypothetical protein [Nitrosopumilaceae archaeon]
MVAVILGIAVICGVLIAIQWDDITKSGGFLDQIQILNPLEMFRQTSAQPLEITNSIEEGLPKFSIEEYLGYTAIKP